MNTIRAEGCLENDSRCNGDTVDVDNRVQNGLVNETGDEQGKGREKDTILEDEELITKGATKEEDLYSV